MYDVLFMYAYVLQIVCIIIYYQCIMCLYITMYKLVLAIMHTGQYYERSILNLLRGRNMHTRLLDYDSQQYRYLFRYTSQYVLLQQLVLVVANFIILLLEYESSMDTLRFMYIARSGHQKYYLVLCILLATRVVCIVIITTLGVGVQQYTYYSLTIVVVDLNVRRAKRSNRFETRSD